MHCMKFKCQEYKKSEQLCCKFGYLAEDMKNYISNIHSCPKLSLQPVLSFSSFVHGSSVNEHKNMKLRENFYYEMIN